MTRSPHLLAFGGAHIDRRGYVSGAYMPAASNPGTLREEVGGGTFNALRWAVRRGLAASLCSMRGGDDAGDRVARATDAAGIRDLSAVFLDRATPSYTALIDADGELIAGLADMGLYDLAFPKQMRRSKLREAAAGADALLCDANLPTAALERCLDLAGGKPCFGIAISPAKVVRFTPLLGRLSVLFMNRREAVAMTGQATTGTGAELVAALRAQPFAQIGSLEGAVAPFGQHGVFGVWRQGRDEVRAGLVFRCGQAGSPEIVQQCPVGVGLHGGLGGVVHGNAQVAAVVAQAGDGGDQVGDRRLRHIVFAQEIVLHVVDQQGGAAPVGAPVHAVAHGLAGHGVGRERGDSHGAGF